VAVIRIAYIQYAHVQLIPEPLLITMRLPSWLRPVAVKLINTLLDTRIVHGIAVRVGATRAGADPEHLFKKMTAALGLIAEYQPHRLRRLPNDMDVIWVRVYRTRLFGQVAALNQAAFRVSCLRTSAGVM
jgi:hypothetical protein